MIRAAPIFWTKVIKSMLCHFFLEMSDFAPNVLKKARPSGKGMFRGRQPGLEESGKENADRKEFVGPTSLLIPHHWPTTAIEFNDFGRLGIFRWFQAQVQKNLLSVKLSFEGLFRRMVRLTGADAYRYRLEVGQKLENTTCSLVSAKLILV